MSNFRGWICPGGDKYRTRSGEDHGDHANRLLRRFYKGWEWEENDLFFEQGCLLASSALEFRSWLRVVCAGSYSLWTPSGPAMNNLIIQIRHLPDNMQLHVAVTEGRFPYRTVGDLREAA